MELLIVLLLIAGLVCFYDGDTSWGLLCWLIAFVLLLSIDIDLGTIEPGSDAGFRPHWR